MSFDPKFTFGSSDGSQNSPPSTSYGSRPVNTLARLAFNIYGSTSSSNPLTAQSSYASNRQSPSQSRGQTPTPPSDHSPTNATFRRSSPDLNATNNNNNNNNAHTTQHQKRYKASYELMSFSLLHNDMQDLAVIAGKNSLQILDMPKGKVVNDLLSTNYAMKNKKVIGSILDVSTGYQYNNKYVATSTTTGSILIFNSQSANHVNKLLYKFSDHSRAVNSVDFSPLDSNLLLSGSQDGQMKLWDMRSNSNKANVTMYGNADAVRCLKFSPFNNKKFVSIFDSGVIQKWDFRQPTQFEKKFNAHTGPGLSLDWNTELDYIVSGGRDKQLQVWNMSSNDVRQIPEHVIYTASPVSKVSFRPNTNLTNISQAEIATSFLNNDLGQAQIYSLKRKYIPLYTIENHSSQITGLNFQNENTLLTSSKDKFFVMDDLLNYRPTVENLSVASMTWSATNDFMFVNQAIQNHTLIEEFDDHYAPLTNTGNQTTPYQNQPQNSFNSTSPTLPNNLSYLSNPTPTAMTPSSNAFPSSSLMSASMSMSMQSSALDMTSSSQMSPRPGFSRTSTTTHFRRPTLNKQNSHTSDSMSNSTSRHYIPHQPVIQKQIHDSQVLNPCVIPVELPINKTNNDLDYLANNYIFNPDEKPVIDTCEYNAQIAMSVGNLRDAQTWRVIKQALAWEDGLDQQLKYAQVQDPDLVIPSIPGDASFRSDSTSQHDNQGQYSTSNSTNYGKSPSLSDLSEFNNSSLNSTNNRAPSFSSSFKISSLKQSILRNHNSNDINVENVIEEEEDTNNETIQVNVTSSDQTEDVTITKKESLLTWQTELDSPIKQSTPQPEENSESQNERPDFTSSKQADSKDHSESESAIEFADAKSIPIVHNRRLHRHSSLGAHSSLGHSISPTFSIDSTGSGSQSLFRPLMHRNLQLSPYMETTNNTMGLSSSFVSQSRPDSFHGQHSVKTQKSNISELTRQLTNTLVVNNNDPSQTSSSLPVKPNVDDYKIPPYAPNKLISKSIEFSLGQGDLIMACTMLLLFNGKYKVYGNEAFKEIIFSYLNYLQKLTFFIQFSKISIFLNENKDFQDLDIEISTVSKTSSSIRHFCSNCGKLITNEQTKAKILQDQKNQKESSKKSNNSIIKTPNFTNTPSTPTSVTPVEAKGTTQLVGTWFCENCSERNKCIYCNEILKKLSLVKLKCGHNGHFGCLKHWFVELNMEDCPGGCI